MTDEVINLTTYYYKKAEIDSLLNQKIDKVLLADVATSGSYNDLDDLPDLNALSSIINILTIAQLTQSSTKLGGFNVPAYSGYVAEELQPGNFYLTKNGLGAAPSNYGGVHSIYDSKGDRYIIEIADDVNLNTYQSISINNRIPGPLFVYCTSSNLKLVNNLSTVEYTGDYNDLTNKPSIPDISGKINVSDVKDNLTSTDTDKPLSANQGKVLKELVDSKADTSHTHNSSDVTDNSAYTNIGSGVNATQKIINDKINTALGIKANANDVYTRNETYTQSEIITLITNAVAELQLFEVVESLPTTNIKTNRLYLIVNGENIANNSYDIYLRVNDNWESLDALEFDISNFYNKIEIDTLLNGKVDTSDARLTNARTPTSHSHGDITNTGTIGTDANKPLITTTNGKITTGSFGTTENTFCQGNDSRLSDARTPTTHTHTKSQITDFPTIPTKTSELTNDSGYLTSHQDISGKEDISNKVTTISSSSTNTQYPSAKAVYDELPKTTKTLTVTYTNGTTEDIEFYIR